MIVKEISLDLWQPNYVTLLANQGEVNSRFISASFKSENDETLNLTDKSVTFYAKKPDGTTIFNNCTVNTPDNTATVMLTSQMSSVAGILECEFQIFNSDNTLLKVNGIQIIVGFKCDVSGAVESSSEFSALTQAINTANSLSDSIGSISDLTTSEKSSVIGAINELNSKTIPISQGGTGGTTAVQARTNLELMKEYVLYYNASGTNSTITLSDAYTNYEKIGVYAISFTGGYPSYNEMLPAVSDVLPIFELNYEGDEVENTIFRGTFLSFYANNVYFSSTAASSVWSTGYAKNLTDGMKVVKIIGYKY